MYIHCCTIFAVWIKSCYCISHEDQQRVINWNHFGRSGGLEDDVWRSFWLFLPCLQNSVLILIFIKRYCLLDQCCFDWNTTLLPWMWILSHALLPTCGSGGALYTCINYAYSRGELLPIYPALYARFSALLRICLLFNPAACIHRSTTKPTTHRWRGDDLSSAATGRCSRLTSTRTKHHYILYHVAATTAINHPQSTKYLLFRLLLVLVPQCNSCFVR